MRKFITKTVHLLVVTHLVLELRFYLNPGSESLCHSAPPKHQSMWGGGSYILYTEISRFSDICKTVCTYSKILANYITPPAWRRVE